MSPILDKKLIAFSGVARVGKNSFANSLQETLKDFAPNLKVQQFSFAESLRQELFHFINDNFNIDVFTEDEEEKAIIRPILIAYGNAKRAQTNNQYWIEKLHKRIERSDCDIAIITDLRYAENEKDELGWFKEQNGKLFHIKRFTKSKNGKSYKKAPNEFEKQNDPKLEAAAFKKFEIPIVDDKDEFFKIIKDECESLVGLFL